MATTHKIRISVSGSMLTFTDVYLSGSAEHKKIKPGDKLSWVCDDGPFSVLFCYGNTPDDNQMHSFSADRGDSTKKLKGKKLGQQGEQAFKYTATVLTSSNSVMADPDVIIDDPGV